ncbi:hypothetical protein HMPREF3190_01755 [Umbribacter vaginalis]|nr:hypothetical protein HMPREF3190_01755 [Coriobacteriales bacterium DNF00809]
MLVLSRTYKHKRANDVLICALLQQFVRFHGAPYSGWAMRA